jgi:hypothetical protein
MTKHRSPAHIATNRSTSPKTRPLAATSLLLAILLAPASLGTPAAHALRAHAARSLNATDTAKLHYIKHTGSQLIEEGTAQGTLPGTMHARASLGTTFTASFTINTHDGTITGHGTATPHGSGLTENFAGTLIVTGGTGRYAHAHGHGGLTGTFNRRTYAIVIKTTGSLSY